MKTITTLLVLICMASAVAQDQLKPDEIAFEKAMTFWEDEQGDEALDAFKAFMKDHPHSPLKPRAHFNTAYINYSMGRYTEAASAFRDILRQDYNEMDENSLMEPYALYKHNSAVYLAEISLEVKDWNDAQRYIHTFDKVYPYQHFCGNEWAAYDIMKARMEARLHEGQGKIDEAVKDLVPHIFFNGLAGNDEAVSDLIDLLRRNYSKTEINTGLQHALASIKLEEKKKSTTGVMTLFGAKVPIDEYIIESTTDVNGLSPEAALKKIVRENRMFVEFLGKE